MLHHSSTFLSLLFFSFLLFYFGGCDYLYILYGFKLTVLLLQSLDIKIIGRCHHFCYQLVLSFKFRAFVVLGDCGGKYCYLQSDCLRIEASFPEPTHTFREHSSGSGPETQPSFSCLPKLLGSPAADSLSWQTFQKLNHPSVRLGFYFYFYQFVLWAETYHIRRNRNFGSRQARHFSELFLFGIWNQERGLQGGCNSAWYRQSKGFESKLCMVTTCCSLSIERQGAEARGTSRFSIVMWEAWGQFRLLVESLWVGQNCCTEQTTCISKILIRFLNFSCFYFTLSVIFLIDFWNCQFFFCSQHHIFFSSHMYRWKLCYFSV